MRWLLLAVLVSITPARADDGLVPASLNLSGSVRTGYFTSNRNLDNRWNYTPTSLWLKAAPDFGDGWYAKGEGWVLDERPLARGSRILGELREGYVGWRNDKVEVSLGRRIIAWGRADRINPTDVISTRDYTRLFAEDEDQRRGSVVATASYAFGDMTATALWLPEFRPNIYPIPRVPGLEVRETTGRLSADQFALRLDHTGGGFDWALSYFTGVNRNPAARLASASPTRLVVDTVYNRVQTWGADFATNVGSYGLRGEVAYSQPGASKGNLFNPRPFVEVVVGADHNLTEKINVNVQYVMMQVFSYADPAAGFNPAIGAIATEASLLNNQRRRFQHGPALRIAYTTLNDTLLLEASALAFISDRSFAVRPRATYAITDHLKLVTGADVFTGPKNTFFGQLRRNTTFLSELRYGF